MAKQEQPERPEPQYIGDWKALAVHIPAGSKPQLTPPEKDVYITVRLVFLFNDGKITRTGMLPIEGVWTVKQIADAKKYVRHMLDRPELLQVFMESIEDV